MKRPINADFSAFTEKMETNHKAPRLKLMIESESQSVRIFLVKVTLKIGQEKCLLWFCFKNNPWTYKMKDLNREKKKRKFLRNNCRCVYYK